MPRLLSSEVLNAPDEDVILAIPAGGVFILKQLLSQFISWDTQDDQDTDAVESILAKTIRLEEAAPMSRLVFAATIESPFIISPNAEAFVGLLIQQLDSEYASYSGNLTLSAGSYIFVHNIRLATNGNRQYLHRLRIRQASQGQLRVWEGWQETTNPTSYSFSTHLSGPVSCYWTYQQLSAGNAGLNTQADSSRIEVFRL